MATKIHPVIEDDQLIKDFEAFVKSEYGKKRSFFGYIIAQQIFRYLAERDYLDYRERYIEIYGSLDISKKDAAHTHKINNADKILIQEIYNRFNVGDEVTFSAICKLIRSECGLKDTRTHKTHIDLLVDLNILDNASIHEYQLYQILEPDKLGDIHG